ncbi:MAG TPA: PKD domain-containing protein, partial [Thermoanaerobaculia bacterium]|nr:PKD domain-containing protein [Thermoanaerobaculia bacterium]
MTTNEFPRFGQRSGSGFFATTARAVFSFTAFAVVAVFLLAATTDAPAQESLSAPSAGFAVATANPAADSKIEFAGEQARDGQSWLWDFGDGSTSRSPRPVHSYASAGEYPVTLTVTTPGGSAVSSRILSVTAANTLRLLGAHPFDITLTATDPRTGRTGEGQVVSQNDIYGIFSIPAITGNADNPEVIVKMVDATGIGQSYWVFYGALTDLRYTLSVREVATGTTKSYNDVTVGTTVCGKFDTSGFGPSPQGLAPEAASFAGLLPQQATEDHLTLLSAHPFDVTLAATDPRTGATGVGQVISQ